MDYYYYGSFEWKVVAGSAFVSIAALAAKSVDIRGSYLDRHLPLLFNAEAVRGRNQILTEGAKVRIAVTLLVGDPDEVKALLSEASLEFTRVSVAE